LSERRVGAFNTAASWLDGFDVDMGTVGEALRLRELVDLAYDGLAKLLQHVIPGRTRRRGGQGRGVRTARRRRWRALGSLGYPPPFER
jgi:hypothetical protein